MKFNSAICTTRDQSERLLALGLKKEAADMHWYKPAAYECDCWFVGVGMEWGSGDIPAWSLHRLIEMMPEDINNMLWFSMGKQEVNYDSIHYIKNFSESTTLYDNLIECIEWLIKEGYFNKEYLVNQAEIDEHCKGVLEYLDYIKGEEE